MQAGVFNGTSGDDPASSSAAAGGIGANGHAKRTRVLLSCAPCRNSKLKCDRTTPCGQCIRKGKPEGCLYAPRPEKKKPAKSMAARLKRLEGMVRGMIDTEGSIPIVPTDRKAGQEQSAGGLVVQGEKATSYVGGTHFMAILEDIEDLKSYFEDPLDDGDEIYDPYENTGPNELLMFSRGIPRDKSELLALLPEKAVIDRLMNRYFTSNSPSQHIIHIPTFLREYNEFCKDPDRAPLNWIAMLYMVLALGVFFSSFAAPHELASDSPMPVMDRFKQYRGAAGWALIWGKYSQPNFYTLQAFLLYVEGDFMTNRDHRMNCYLLSSVLIRLMLKMGLHRDPSKLPNITPYDGEMRRRLWNIAIQIELLVAFNLGLPSMVHGIETDTELPSHLMDTDFDKDTKELPPARPDTEYTSLTYPINKARMIRVFFLVVRQAHALRVPTYAEVMKLDSQIEEIWNNIPPLMKMKPIEECVMEEPVRIIQRFGIAAIYQKSRCVLHRRYLAELVPKEEHDYSRRICFEAALALLDLQNTMHEATKPGGMLRQTGWFVAALVAVNDFLLADMVLALMIQDDKYWEEGSSPSWIAQSSPPFTKDRLLYLLKRSYNVWCDMSGDAREFKKAEEVVRTILQRIQAKLQIDTSLFPNTSPGSFVNENTEMLEIADLSISSGGPSTISNSNEPGVENFADFGAATTNTMDANDISDSPWTMQNGYDWRYFDPMAHDGGHINPAIQMTQDAWLAGKTAEDFPELLAPNAWSFHPS
ncbi:fungal-specific transcription factor domain-containing protein [Daldinia loculata]|uniref:fungal-specific transcription factor domain-containing protein n=1 Tax=Daldinia loculata TaxID=103429 RepID=UPI0020C2866C|nr:fungal-specific transcription factor domain-containing protein [Daldinia loculata]KAI1648130.1 fungal-specific transcription factor domain-containing protein [Daldinia loculata]